MVQCPVSRCRRGYQTTHGLAGHLLAGHNVQPADISSLLDRCAPVRCLCVDTDEGSPSAPSGQEDNERAEVTATDGVSGPTAAVAGPSVREVGGGDPVFFELIRTFTSPEQANRACVAAQSSRRGNRRGGRRRRAGRRRRSPPTPSGGSAAGDEASDFAPGRDVESAGNGCEEGVPRDGPSAGVCAKVFSYYELFGDTDNAVTAFPVPDKLSPFTSAQLRFVFIHTCTEGGVGMTQNELRRLYHYTLWVERAGGATTAPFATTFPTLNRFIAAMRAEKRALVAPLGWRKINMRIEGGTYKVFFRDALEAVRREIKLARPEDLRWGPEDASEGCAEGRAGQGTGQQEAAGQAPSANPVLRNGWDGEMFAEHRRPVIGTISTTCRVLGLHIYSDATVLSGSGAVSAYPLRMRILSHKSKQERWVTLAFIPQVAGSFLDSDKGQDVRAQLLQRILHVVVRTCMQASHEGTLLDLPGGGRQLISPRALLYVCDQPEERAVMCLKASGCQFPCTPCMCPRDASCAAEGVDARSRVVAETVSAQIANATMGEFWGAATRRAELELPHSLNSVVPALAAWAGLGNGPELLYCLPGFDLLHVSLIPCPLPSPIFDSCFWRVLPFL